MKSTIVSLTLSLLFSVFNTNLALASIEIKYKKPYDAAEKRAMKEIKASTSNETLQDLSKKLFPFKKALTIQYGGKEGPLYDSEIHTVFIPYTFYTDAIGTLKRMTIRKSNGTEPKKAAMDTLLHTLLHEVGHAYVYEKNIPILGKEEDAVDNFATILLIEYVDNGGEVAISAADMFDFESKDRPDYYEFDEYIDDHSFDLQRYFSTLCLVYGSDPETYKGLLDEIEKDYVGERKEFCEFQYGHISDNWHRYLKPQKSK